MKINKIITVLIIINLILIGIIYNFISKVNVNNKKQIIKEMTETEYEDNITSLNQSHTDYANYIQESKAQIASAITEMGVETSNDETLETMVNNIKSISNGISEVTVLYNGVKSASFSANRVTATASYSYTGGYKYLILTAASAIYTLKDGEFSSCSLGGATQPSFSGTGSIFAANGVRVIKDPSEGTCSASYAMSASSGVSGKVYVNLKVIGLN